MILSLLRVLYTLENTEDILQFLVEGLWQRTICNRLTQGTGWTAGTIYRAARPLLQLDNDKVIGNFSKFVHIERNEKSWKFCFICDQFKVKIVFQIGFLQQRLIGWKKLKGITMVVKFILQKGVSNFQNRLVVSCFMIIGWIRPIILHGWFDGITWICQKTASWSQAWFATTVWGCIPGVKQLYLPSTEVTFTIDPSVSLAVTHHRQEFSTQTYIARVESFFYIQKYESTAQSLIRFLRSDYWSQSDPHPTHSTESIRILVSAISHAKLDFYKNIDIHLI